MSTEYDTSETMMPMTVLRFEIHYHFQEKLWRCEYVECAFLRFTWQTASFAPCLRNRFTVNHNIL